MRNFFAAMTLGLLALLAAACQAETPIEAAKPTVTVPAIAPPTSLPPVKTAAPVRISDRWQVVKEITPEHKPKVAAFLNELFGVTGCGESLQPSFTSDGGQTWHRPVMGQFCPDGVDIVDGRSVWLCNAFGVFTSKDGGQTLSQMYSPYDGCRILSFADDNHGWSSFDWNLAATDDGALRWLAVDKDYNMGDIAALSRISPEEGYVLTYDGTLFRTGDGGANWTAHDLEVVSDEMRIANFDGRPPAAMQFQEDGSGIIVLALAGQGSTQFFALHTADGGETWERHDLPLNLGPVYLSHDGRFLTVTELGGSGKIILLENRQP